MKALSLHDLQGLALRRNTNIIVHHSSPWTNDPNCLRKKVSTCLFEIIQMTSIVVCETCVM